MTPAQSYFATHAAVVVDNRDPLGNGRCRLRVPGLIEPVSDWVEPASIGGGHSQYGIFMTPPIDADVYVFFVGANPDRPRYLGGHWARRAGEPEHPTVVVEADDKASASAHVASLETKRWVVALDDRPGRERLWITGKTTAPTTSNQDPAAGEALTIELDLVAGTLSVSAPAAVALRSAGQISIEGTVITIGGRAVLQTTKQPI